METRNRRCSLERQRKSMPRNRIYNEKEASDPDDLTRRRLRNSRIKGSPATIMNILLAKMVA